METGSPRVTVVIPTRNRWHLLPTALTAAFSQEGVAVDVIVVDDASARPAPVELESGERALELVRLDVNRGLAGARNAGVARAGGDWVAFLDDDDVWAPDKLHAQIAAATKARAGWAYSTAVMVDGDGIAEYVWPLPDPATLLERLVASNAIPAGSSNVVVRADVLRSAGGFDEAFSRIADWDLWLRLAAAGPAAAVDRALVAYRQHTGNMSGGGRRELLAEFALLAAKHRDLAADRGLAFDQAGVERWAERERRRGTEARAREQLHRGRRLRAAGVFAAAALRHRDRDSLREAVRLGTARVRGRGPARPEDDRAARVEQPAWLAAYR